MPEYYDPLLAGIVRIHGENQIVGTGFILTLTSNHVMIATCTHVVQLALSSNVLEEDAIIVLSFDIDPVCTPYKALLYKWLPDNKEDVAILKLCGALPNKIRSLPLASTARSGSHIVSSFGYPDISDFTGIWGLNMPCRLGTRRTSTGKRWLQLESRTIAAGFSGAPVWDDTWRRTIGMISRISEQDDSGRIIEQVFALPIEAIQEMIPDLFIAIPSPFHPSEPCTEGEIESFFGDVESMNLLAQRLDENQQFLAILGPAGCGKTSLVQVDLIPKIRNGMVLKEEHEGIVKTNLSAHPCQDLESAGLIGATTDLEASIHEWCQREHCQRMVLVLDQFENMLLYASTTEQRDMLTQFCSIAKSNTATIIILLRDELYHLLSIHTPFLRLVEENLVNVVAPSKKEDLMRIAQQRAQISGFAFDASFLEEITDRVIHMYPEIKEQQSALLTTYELVLDQIWRGQRDSDLLSSYATGREIKNINTWAEEIFCGLTEQKQIIVQHLFLQLVHLESRLRGTPDTRRSLTIKELCQTTGEQELIYQLADWGLLAVSRNLENHEETTMIAQNAILQEWARLNQWLEDKNRFEQWYSTFAQQIVQEPVAALSQPYPSEERQLELQLKEAELWMARYPEVFGQAEKDYIQRGKQNLYQENEQQKIQLKLIRQSQATQARQLAKQAEALCHQHESGLESAFIVALEAIHLLHCLETDQCIRHCFEIFPSPTAYYHLDHACTSTTLNAHMGMGAFAQVDGKVTLLKFSNGQNTQIYTNTVINVALSLECSYLVITQRNGTIDIWQPLTQQHLITLKEREIQAVIMSPDERRLAVAYGDNRHSHIALYIADTWKRYHVFPEQPIISAMAFSPEGRYLAVGYTNASVRIWDVTGYPHPLQTGELEQGLGHKDGGAICNLAFSPGGDFLAVVSDDGYATLWRWRSLTCLLSYPQRTGINAITFSPNGSYLAIASNNCVAALFQLSANRQIANFLHKGPIQDIAFSLDEKFLATASKDYTVCIWDTMTCQRTAVLAHTKSIEQVSFKMDSYDLFTVSNADAIIHWNTLHNGHCMTLPVQAELHRLFFIRNNGTLFLVTVNQQGQIAYWQEKSNFARQGSPISQNGNGLLFAVNESGYCIGSGRKPTEVSFWNMWVKESQTFISLENSVVIANLCPNGYYGIVVEEHQVSIWNVEIGEQCWSILTNAPVTYASISADAQYIFFLDKNNDLNIWHWPQKQQTQVVSPEQVATINIAQIDFQHHLALTGDQSGVIRAWKWMDSPSKPLYEVLHNGAIHAIAFQAHGRFFATASADHTACVYETTTGDRHLTLIHRAEVYDVLFSPDDLYVITTSEDKAVNIWDINDGHQLARLPHLARIKTVVFSSDSKYIATADEHGQVKIWLWRTEDLETELQRRISGNGENKDSPRSLPGNLSQ